MATDSDTRHKAQELLISDLLEKMRRTKAALEELEKIKPHLHAFRCALHGNTAGVSPDSHDYRVDPKVAECELGLRSHLVCLQEIVQLVNETQCDLEVRAKGWKEDLARVSEA